MNEPLLVDLRARGAALGALRDDHRVHVAEDEIVAGAAEQQVLAGAAVQEVVAPCADKATFPR